MSGTSGTTGSSNLRLHPWRDGLEHCLRLLEPPASATTSTGTGTGTGTSTSTSTSKQATVSAIRNGQFTPAAASSNHRSNSGRATNTTSSVRSVDLCFHDADYPPAPGNKAQHQQWMELFEAIGNLPQLESIMMRVTLSPTSSSASTHNFPRSKTKQGGGNSIFPPLAALTTALSSAPNVGYLTLIGVPIYNMTEGDTGDYDVNGWCEVIRIHPTLHSMVVKDCSFASLHHIQQLQSKTRVLPAQQQQQQLQQEQQRALQLDVINPKVVDVSKLPDEDNGEKPWYQSIFSACLFPVACCM